MMDLWVQDWADLVAFVDETQNQDGTIGRYVAPTPEKAICLIVEKIQELSHEA